MISIFTTSVLHSRPVTPRTAILLVGLLRGLLLLRACVCTVSVVQADGALVCQLLIACATVPHSLRACPRLIPTTKFGITIIVRAVLSWVSPHDYNPATTVILSLTEPILRPLRAVLPPLAGVDLSPLAAIIAIQVVKMLVMPPLDRIAPGLMM